MLLCVVSLGKRMEFTIEGTRGHETDEILIIFNHLAYSLCPNHPGA